MRLSRCWRTGTAMESRRFEHRAGGPPYFVRSGRTQGSWGQGRVYYRVRTEEGRLFDLYYDRAPKGQRRAGAWFLWRELSAEEELVGLEEDL